MRVAFRVDASTAIGTGHVMRCLALADHLQDRGAEVLVLSRPGDGDLIGRVRDRGLDVRELHVPGDDADADADAALAAVGEVDWLVVDHYGLDARWERRMRDRAARILAIDDLADRDHDADVLMDTTYPGNVDRYTERVPEQTRLLLGPRFALMTRAFARGRGARRSGAASRVLVFFGGSDLPNLTTRTLQALSDPRLAHLRVDVVVGAANPHHAEVAALAEARPGTRVLGPQPDLAAVMAQADLAVGAGGVTSWERMCMGIPSVVVSIAENQRASCVALSSRGLLTYLGDEREATERAIAEAVRALLDDPSRMQDESELGRAYVDGLGAQRVAELLMATPRDDLSIRRARADDVGTYFMWVNDPEVRRQSIISAEVGWEEHRAWFESRLMDANCHLLVLEAHGLPVGQARFEQSDGATKLDYSIDAAFRGRGWAGALLSRALDALPDVGTVLADVRADNARSRNALVASGFVPEGATDDDVVRLRLDRSNDR